MGVWRQNIRPLCVVKKESWIQSQFRITSGDLLDDTLSLVLTCRQTVELNQPRPVRIYVFLRKHR